MSLPILLALAAALLIGASDFLSSQAGKAAPAMPIVVNASIGGGLLAVLTVVLIPGSLGWQGLLIGGISGIGIALGLVSLYHGIELSSIGIASPAAGVLAIVLPVIVGVANGDKVSALSWIGIVVAVLSLVPVTFSPELGGHALKGLGFGVLSGVFFGVAFAALGFSDSDGGMWPVMVQKLVGIAFLAALLKLRHQPIRPTNARSRRLSLVGGALGTLGVVSMTAGMQRGSLTLVIVVASMYPGVTTLLGVMISGDRLRWWQAVGVAGALAGIAMVILGA